MTDHRKVYGHILLLLLTLFILRVLAQLAQFTFNVGFLPPFAAWQSGAVPYAWLLCAQAIIIIWFARVILGFYSKTITRTPLVGRIYLGVGAVYFIFMIIRLIAGLTIAAGHAWWGATIPSIFHLVLASFLIVVGLFHCCASQWFIRWGAYPLAIGFAVFMHILLIGNNWPLALSALLGAEGVTAITVFIPVIFVFLIIVFLENYFPYKKSWLPTQANIINDALFMLVIQVFLPKLISFLLVLLFAQKIGDLQLTSAKIWPHTLPITIQVLLMIIVADFLRYWLHRLAHNWPPLWRLHAVHHSPHKLYAMNVGRFHPLEKSLQYVLDALPFVVLGVSESVLGLYFIFYAINGFFQHCNIDIHLGKLNYLVSGPELHRWHHSKLINESNTNYGNNLIIWDLLFGTYFLPKHNHVKDLGLINRHYPMNFFSQMIAPFKKGLDKKYEQ